MPSRRSLAVALSLALAGAGSSAPRAAWGQAEAPDPARPSAPAEAPDAARPAAPRQPARRAPAKAKAPKAKAPKVAPAAPAAPAAEPGEGLVDPYSSPEPTSAAKVVVPPRLALSELAAMQGLLAVQRLDGWLLRDAAGEGPLALRLVAPIFRPQHAWYYWLPVSGEPTVVCHQVDAGAFEKVRGKLVTYQRDRDRDRALRALLKGKKTIALELVSGAGGPPALQPPAELRPLVRVARVTAVSSDRLAQYTTAVWGEPGYLAHHVAAHHLVELRKDALAFVAQKLRAGAAVTDIDVVERLARGMKMRGVVGPAPAVAVGVHTAEPGYRPSAERATAIKVGDLVTVGLAVKLDRPDGIFAAQTWVAFAGAEVPAQIAEVFSAVASARDRAIAFLAQRTANRQPMRGFEVDRVARGLLSERYPKERFAHELGHSIDAELDGAGADLDGFGAPDERTLVPGTGVTVGPGLYFPGELGVSSEVTVFLSPSGPQVTTPPQDAVQALLAP